MTADVIAFGGTIHIPTKYSLYIVRGSISFHGLPKQPSRFHRFVQKVLLGWEWEVVPGTEKKP